MKTCIGCFYSNWNIPSRNTPCQRCEGREPATNKLLVAMDTRSAVYNHGDSNNGDRAMVGSTVLVWCSDTKHWRNLNE